MNREVKCLGPKRRAYSEEPQGTYAVMSYQSQSVLPWRLTAWHRVHVGTPVPRDSVYGIL
jgi:hypothetical protein